MVKLHPISFKKITSLIPLICTIFSIQAQVKTVIPPSPNIATFERFGDYPVNYSTGLPQISVPLYTIKLKDFSFPIGIDFHASGRRASVDFSTIGVGWALNASGYISREIRERPDEKYMDLEMTRDSLINRQFNNIETTYARLIKADMTVANGAPNEGDKYDAEHDIFSFNINGLSGKFIIRGNGDVTFLTYCPYKLAYNSLLNTFILTDDKGIRYSFGDSVKNAVESTDTGSGYANTGWFLTEILTPSGETITFNYQSRRTVLPGDNISAINYEYNDIINGYSPNFSYPDENPDFEYFSLNLSGYHLRGAAQSTLDYSISYLKSIIFPTGKITLTYDSLDIRLTRFQISNLLDIPIRKVDFNYIQTPGTHLGLPNNNSYSINTLSFKNASDVTGEVYKFEYYNNQLSSSSSVQNFIAYKDWWGYSNLSGNQIPYNPIYDPGMVGRGCTTCKSPDFYEKLSGMIKRITFPTGGNSEFKYEANYYKDYAGDIKAGPGIRIQEIVKDDGSGINKVSMKYKYGENESGAGILLREPNTEDFKSYDVATLFVGMSYYYVKHLTPNPVQGMAGVYQQPVYYSYVTEYLSSANGTVNGKTIYNYSTPQVFFADTKNMYVKSWSGNKLLKEEKYEYRAALNNYRLIEKTTNIYQQVNYIKIPQIKLVRRWNFPASDIVNDRWQEVLYMNNNGWNPGPIFSFTDNPIESTVEKIRQQTVIKYDESGALMNNVTEYAYGNPKHAQPTQIITSVGNDERMYSENKYPSDFNVYPAYGAIQQGILNLQDKNIITSIETSNYKSSLAGADKRLLSSQLVIYNATNAIPDSILTVDLANPITNFTPAYIQSGAFIKDSRYVKKHVFDKYDDKLNLLQQHVADGIHHSYKWGYNKQFPIAEVKNASFNEFFFQNFEESLDFSSNISLDNGHVHTGKTSAKISNSTVAEKTSRSSNPIYLNLVTKKRFIFSGWIYSDGPSAELTLLMMRSGETGYSSYIDNIQTTEQNKWTYVQKTIEVPVDVASVFLRLDNNGLGNVWFDDLRIYPENGIMHNYTYEPQIGMTSAIDAKGQTSYYEYDDFQRLKNIKDADGNIIKSYNYHYKP